MICVAFKRSLIRNLSLTLYPSQQPLDDYEYSELIPASWSYQLLTGVPRLRYLCRIYVGDHWATTCILLMFSFKRNTPTRDFVQILSLGCIKLQPLASLTVVVSCLLYPLPNRARNHSYPYYKRNHATTFHYFLHRNPRISDQNHRSITSVISHCFDTAHSIIPCLRRYTHP